MEGQTHLILGKKRRKNEPIVSLHETSDKPNSGKKEKRLTTSFHGRSVNGEKKE